MKTPDIKVWVEGIDDHAVAICARCFWIKRGGVHGWSCFVIVGKADYWRMGVATVREIAQARWKQDIREKHYGLVPYIGDVNSRAGLLVTG